MRSGIVTATASDVGAGSAARIGGPGGCASCATHLVGRVACLSRHAHGGKALCFLPCPTKPGG